MTTLYDLTTLELGFTDVAAAASTARSYLEQHAPGGILLACFHSEFGPVNRLLLLRAFPTADALATDRQHVRQDTDPFGCADVLTGLRAETFALFPGFPTPRPGAFGPVYELRTYGVRSGRLDGLMTQWTQARPSQVLGLRAGHIFVGRPAPHHSSVGLSQPGTAKTGARPGRAKRYLAAAGRPDRVGTRSDA